MPPVRLTVGRPVQRHGSERRRARRGGPRRAFREEARPVALPPTESVVLVTPGRGERATMTFSVSARRRRQAVRDGALRAVLRGSHPFGSPLPAAARSRSPPGRLQPAHHVRTWTFHALAGRVAAAQHLADAYSGAHGATSRAHQSMERSRDGSGRSAAAAGVQGVGAGGPDRRPVRLLRARVAGVPHLSGQASDAAAGRRPPRNRSLYGQGHHRRPAGLPPQRPHGVRLGVRPRRVPGARLHR